jgi:hypothetical protein
VASTGILTDKGAYTQGASGILGISIGGATAGTQFDQLNVTSASLNGTLNIHLINGFVPKIGQTFKIMNFTSKSGTTFSTVNGLAINSSEHFTIAYQDTDVLLTVASGPAMLRNQRTSGTLRTLSAPSIFGALAVAPSDAGYGNVQFSRFSTPRFGALAFMNSVGRVDTAGGVRIPATLGNSSVRAPRVGPVASALGRRSMAGGLSWGLSNLLSKPKLGFEVQ